MLCLDWFTPFQVLVTKGSQLFNKNIADCERESVSTVSESWSVPVC